MSNTNHSDSDISSFAAWETQNPPAQTLSAKQQSMLDMKDPARVWKDRDSSNDARSSEGGSAEENTAQPKDEQVMTEAPDLLKLQTSVQDFAREHPFWTQSVYDGEAALEFENDVFEFAREAGLGVGVAQLEVGKALGAWKIAKGLGVQTGLNVDVEAGKVFGKVLQTIELVGEAIGGGKRKRDGDVKPVLVESTQNGKEGREERKEPNLKRQRRKDKKKLGDGDVPLEGPHSSVQAGADTLGAKGDANTKGSKRQRSKRKLGEEGIPAIREVEPTIVSSVVEEAESRTPKLKDVKKKQTAEEDSIKKVMTSAPASELKSAKRIKNEKKKEKKKRAKSGPTSSSYFAQPDATAFTKTKQVSPISVKGVPARSQMEDTQMDDAPEKKQTVEEVSRTSKENIEQIDAVDRDEKKKRKKKRNKNRLPVVETTDAAKSAEERTARKTDRSTVLKDGKAAEPSAKKKRVRSRRTKADGDDSKGSDKTTVAKPEAEEPAGSKKTYNQEKDSKVSSEPSTINETTVEDVLIRPLRTFDANGVFGPPGSSNPNLPKLAIEAAAFEQTPTKEKSRKRKKSSDTQAEAQVEAGITAVEFNNVEESEPPKKKSRDRKRKSDAKSLDISTKEVEVPAAIVEPMIEPHESNSAVEITNPEAATLKKHRHRKRKSDTKLHDIAPAKFDALAAVAEPLIELPDANSEKKKQHKSEKSRKRPSGMEVVAKAIEEEASNSRHS
ncbi:uncharacterized protein RSE6_10683 [Rhynchosporium secalis]|uniref:Uncharacterized protein n=1 Tax=Rhynchosporium secalis TaxID=38038 RepID=A0A1E1ML41_RHYSE|nr:uncharacterized protein RSE6_10683 [Rhynchosporium secalis]